MYEQTRDTQYMTGPQVKESFLTSAEESHSKAQSSKPVKGRQVVDLDWLGTHLYPPSELIGKGATVARLHMKAV
jgi:hypothetical protein